jgi:hypothetical protein
MLVRTALPARAAYPRQVINDIGWNVVFSLTPTILLGLIFWLVMRSILRADRTERKVYTEIEVEERARFAEEHSTRP